MSECWFSQAPYRVRLEWGRDGALRAAARGDILVIVDVLSFSTCAVTAVRQGVVLYPCQPGADVEELARRVDGVAGVSRGAAPERGRFSLSPLSYQEAVRGTRVVLPSPNGAACCRIGREAPLLLVGAIVNAEAVAGAVYHFVRNWGNPVTLVACGERWETFQKDGPLRVAVEDYLGAGAILAHLPEPDLSPEARVCRSAFLGSRPELETILLGCGSGRELQERGFEEDVRHAARLNIYAVVPVLRGDRLEAWNVEAEAGKK